MAWIGVLIRAGLDKDSFRPVELFSTKTGPPIYCAFMSRSKFKELMRCLRCDDMSTQEVQKIGEQGKLAPMHELWQKFIEACQINYKAGPDVTVDESLLSRRGRCSFKVYMPSKLTKYGINVWSVVNPGNLYLLDAQVCRGKGPGGPEQQ